MAGPGNAGLGVLAPARRRRTLKGKLILLVIASVGVAVALVAGVSAWREGKRDAALQTERLRATATIMSSLSADAAAAKDRSKAFRVLRSIVLMPGVFYARIEQPDGSLLVETGGGARLTRDVSLSADAVGTPGLWRQLQSRTSEVSAPILHENRLVGRVVLLSRTEGTLNRFLASLVASLIAAMAAVAVGLTVAWRMQRRITRPIVALTRSMQKVRRDHDYAQAVDVSADDEIGELVDGFNQMLGEIQVRDRRIAAQVADLESEVAVRTADLRDAKEVAEAANSAKSDFLATMSHEIRTPMNGIMVMAEMLAAGEMPPRQRRFADIIAKSGSSLMAIINDILDFSKIEAGKMDLESVPLDLSEVADDVCSLFWERASSKGLDLAAYVDPSIPQLIAGDPVRLRQVIGNLINNAIKFTEDGGVFVEVVPDGPGGVRINVHDTGLGIAKDKLDTVFGAFSQADQSTTRRFGGTGLGLAICKRLVEAMNGELSVSSDFGQGSIFSVRLPVSLVAGAQPWAGTPATGACALVTHAGPFTSRALERYLSDAGFKIALDPLAQGSLAVIAGDPASLAQLGPVDAPTICLAAYGESLPHELRCAGAVNAVLTQPFQRRELKALLEQVQAGRPLSELPAPGLAEPPSSTLPTFSGARVLVADDSAVNREVAMEALARLSITPKLVTDGRAAVEAATAEAFDLILMDGSMPELDGYDATREIRRMEGNARRTPIVALTAHVVGAGADAWREADMDAVLHKPFTLAALAEVLSRYLSAEDTGRFRIQEADDADPAPEALSPCADSDGLIDPEIAAQLVAIAGSGRTDFVAKVHGLYRDNAPGCVASLLQASAAVDADAAARSSHALKSMSFNIGATLVSRISAEIEAAAREGRAPSAARVADLSHALDRTLALIDVDAAPSPKADVPKLRGDETTTEELQLLEDLREGLIRDEFSLVYQPQVDRDGARTVGVEALIRWTHPVRGPISPDVFIPLAERHGVISSVTSWVANRVMLETTAFPGFQVAFNASAAEFARPGFADRLRPLIATHAYDASRLEVEITETAILTDEIQVRTNMEQLHDLGVKVALDDFGAGYSSLGHLLRYPFDKLKVDRAFVTDCSHNVQSAAIVHAVVSVGRALGMKVIAEGVETENQRKFLRAAGVHAMQGYLLGKPMSIDALRESLSGEPERASA